MTFDAKQYKHDYYKAHKAETQAYNKKYYARPENVDYFLEYREKRREHYQAYSKRRRALIKAGLWVFRDPKKNKKHKPLKPIDAAQTRIKSIQTGWQAYFDKKNK